MANVYTNQRNRPVQNSGKQGASMHSNAPKKTSGVPKPCPPGKKY